LALRGLSGTLYWTGNNFLYQGPPDECGGVDPDAPDPDVDPDETPAPDVTPTPGVPTATVEQPVYWASTAALTWAGSWWSPNTSVDYPVTLTGSWPSTSVAPVAYRAVWTGQAGGNGAAKLVEANRTVVSQPGQACLYTGSSGEDGWTACQILFPELTRISGTVPLIFSQGYVTLNVTGNNVQVTTSGELYPIYASSLLPPQPTPTPTPEMAFYLGEARKMVALTANQGTCRFVDSIEWPGLDAAADPVIGTCYDLQLQGEDGIEFAEVASGNDGYGAPWLSFWSDSTGTGAGFYRTCVSDGYTIPGGPFVDAAAVCAQACPGRDRLLGVGDWPKTVDGDYVATWQLGCYKNGSLIVDNMGLIYYGTPPPPAPTPTITATWLSPTPWATSDPDRCRTFDWRDDVPAGDVDIDWDDLVVEGACYTVLPQAEIDVPGLPLGIGGGAHIEWDGFAVCVNWVRFPTVQVLGIGVALDWFLLPALAWLVNRMLTL
jgi:hypothetical protein